MRPLLFFTLLLTSLISQLSFGQCGTVLPADHIKNPRIMSESDKSVVQYNLNKTLRVHVYIVASGFESYDYSSADYLPRWETANGYFEDINLQFEICEETLIPNYNYNVLSHEVIEPDADITEENQMLAQYYSENVINVYYVEEIIDNGAAGYAYLPGGPDVIVLTKGHADFTIEHELGHFFGLYHTFQQDFGLELADGSNCESTGDLVCDTPADYNPNDEGLPCPHENSATDANGDYYTPMTSNIMSYYSCTCSFTSDQYNRMAWTFLNERNYLW